MKCEKFVIQELVPEEVYKKRGEKAWELIDPRLITTIDAIKRKFSKGTMTINNYKWGGDRSQSCLRTLSFYKSAEKMDSSFSQHKYGRAIDCVFSAYSTDEVRQYIIDNPKEFPYVKGIELGTTWLHVDVRNTPIVKTFYP